MNHVLSAKHAFRFSGSVESGDTYDVLYKALGENDQAELISKDIAEITDMFSYLFDLEQIGIRLTALDSAMCPKFHAWALDCCPGVFFWGKKSQLR